MYFQTCVSGTPSLLAATVTTHGLVTHCSGLGNSQSESTDWTRTTGTVREELERKKIFFCLYGSSLEECCSSSNNNRQSATNSNYCTILGPNMQESLRQIVT